MALVASHKDDDDVVYVAFDIESTGLSVYSDRAVQIGAVSSDGDTFNELVNPKRPIPPDATAVHGISNADVASARDFVDVFDAFVDWIVSICGRRDATYAHRRTRSVVLLTFNGQTYDEPLLFAECARADRACPVSGIKRWDKLQQVTARFLDAYRTLRWHRCPPEGAPDDTPFARALRGARNARATTLERAYRHFFGEGFEHAHTATADARAVLRLVSEGFKRSPWDDWASARRFEETTAQIVERRVSHWLVTHHWSDIGAPLRSNLPFSALRSILRPSQRLVFASRHEARKAKASVRNLVRRLQRRAEFDLLLTAHDAAIHQPDEEHVEKRAPFENVQSPSARRVASIIA